MQVNCTTSSILKVSELHIYYPQYDEHATSPNSANHVKYFKGEIQRNKKNML